MNRMTPDDGRRTLGRLLASHSAYRSEDGGPFDHEGGCVRHAARIAHVAGIHGIDDHEERTLPVLAALMNGPHGGGIACAGDARHHRKDIYRHGVTDEQIAGAASEEAEMRRLRRRPVAALWTILNQRGVLAVVWAPFGEMQAGQRVGHVERDWRHDPRTSFIASESEEIDRIEGFETLLHGSCHDDEVDAVLRNAQLDALGAWQLRAQQAVRDAGVSVEWLQYVVREGDGIGWRTVYDTHVRQLEAKTDPDRISLRISIGGPDEVARLLAEGRAELAKGKRDLLERWRRHGRSRHDIVRAGHAIQEMLEADMVPQDLLDALGVVREGERAKLERVRIQASRYVGMLPTRPGYID